MKRLLLLTLVAGISWLVLLGPGWLLWGPAALRHSLAALGLCLVPALATLGWSLRMGRRTPEMQVLFCLGGTGVRLFVVLGLGLILSLGWPEQYPEVFWGWLLVFYLLLLGTEMALLLRTLPAGNPESKNSAA